MRMSRITNGRWVTSALGTASSAALSGADTVYSVTPLYHPSGLMSASAARSPAARGWRMADGASSRRAFWDEVRRYGVTVASYTWTMLHDLVDAPPAAGRAPSPGAAVHRLGDAARPVAPGAASASRPPGCSSSTPRPRPARSSSTCVTPSRARWAAGCPGSPEVRLGAYDAERRQLELGHDGFVRACRTDEVGMLLARARRRDAIATTPLRGVFARDDAWLSTGDLFRRDADGDYWRLDSARE